MRDDDRREEDGKTRRDKRLAEALRANLKRRKAHRRARAVRSDNKADNGASAHTKESG